MYAGASRPSETSGLIAEHVHNHWYAPHAATKTAQPNQSSMMSKSISSPLFAFTSGRAFEVMDKTGCERLIYMSGAEFRLGSSEH